VEILRTHGRGGAELEAVVSSEEITAAQEKIPEVFVHDDMMGYIVQIVEATRARDGVMLGVSARGALVLMRTAQAFAAVNAREFVIPDDVKAAAVPALAHRLILRGSERIKKTAAEDIIAEILQEIPVPTEFI
jgi:MoxR-like ATPase